MASTQVGIYTTFLDLFLSSMPNCNQHDFIHANIESALYAAGGYPIGGEGGLGAVELKLREAFPNTPCYSGSSELSNTLIKSDLPVKKPSDTGDSTGTLILLGAVALGLLYLFGSKK